MKNILITPDRKKKYFLLFCFTNLQILTVSFLKCIFLIHRLREDKAKLHSWGLALITALDYMRICLVTPQQKTE